MLKGEALPLLFLWIVYRSEKATEPGVIARVRSTRGNLIVGSYFYCGPTKTSKILPRDCHAPSGLAMTRGILPRVLIR